jgi:tetraacyldisaccharide 4'-kinase
LPYVTATLAGLFDSIWYGNHPLRWLLWPFGQAYRLAVAVRRALYRLGMIERVEIGVPVVVIGNVTVGGTGKTPCVIWLARALRERGYRPGVICRGYGGRAVSWPQQVAADSDAAVVGDESVVLARRSGCPVAAGPDRAAAAASLLERHGVDVLVSDDGLQHYRLSRDAEIAVVDGRRGLGNGWCLPAGPLREPARRLRRVDAIVVNGPGWERGGAFHARMAPTVVRQTTTGATRKLADFEGQRVHAVAGIGNPQRFFELLEEHGISVEAHPLPDHAQIAAADLEFSTPGVVMITEKDEVKCRTIAHDGVWCVVAEMEFDDADAARLLQIVLRSIDRGAP